jgi:hypothetical protein
MALRRHRHLAQSSSRVRIEKPGAIARTRHGVQLCYVSARERRDGDVRDRG